MDYKFFCHTLEDDVPPEHISKILQALWHDHKGQWDRAHDMVQVIGSREASWVHAYLHRKEGDYGNASYWYNRANRPMYESSLQAEWEEIVRELLQTASAVT